MMRKPILALAVSAVLTVAVFAAPSDAPKSTTVGAFAVKVSAALGQKAADPKAAADTLRSMGVNLGKDLSAPLTEERAKQILTDLGASNLRTSNPGNGLSAAKADQLLASVSLSSAATSIAPEALPTQCLNSFNRGTCVECCKVEVGLITNVAGKLQDPGTVCSNFCKSVLPPGQASPSEPQ
jgi:hypothetical protein